MSDHPSLKRIYQIQSGGFPLEQVLVIETGDQNQKELIVCAFFADAELDVFIVEYGPEGEIIIRADEVTHITTAPFQLEKICALFDTAQALNEELSQFFDADTDQYTGYEHLLSRPNAP